MKKVRELFKGIDHRLINIEPDFALGGMSSDSRTIEKGDLFIAVKGCTLDGHDFIKEAIKKGAGAICAERQVKDAGGTGFIILKDAAKALPVLASRFFEAPSKSLKLIGITGTNGKTTTSHLVYEILKTAKKSPSLIGTIQYKIRDEAIASCNTTPGTLLLHSLLGRMRDCGTDYVVTEVSSHALKQSRVSGMDFSFAVLTNITGDHLDYHRTMRDYIKSKRLLFESLRKDAFAILNRDDKSYDEFKRSTKGKVVSYAIDRDADFKATHIESRLSGSRFFLDTPDGTMKAKTPLVGQYNIYNILAAAAVSFAEGIEVSAICEGIGRFDGIAGRLEPVAAGRGFKVFIDYAHTHDALENVLLQLRKLSGGRIVVVFGCGGDRDRTKRPKMGRIASRIADYVILTNDNPRGEDPCLILEEIEKGFGRGFKNYKKIPDRHKAIEEALSGREPSDTVLIAGKGHEDYQIIGGKAFPFNDKKAVEKILNDAKAYV